LGSAGDRSKQFVKARQQIGSVQITPAGVAERLAAGLVLDTTQKSFRSTLKIIDPPSTEPEIWTDVEVRDFAIRAIVGRALALVGLSTAASEFMDPTGRIRQRLGIRHPFSDVRMEIRRAAVAAEISRIPATATEVTAADSSGRQSDSATGDVAGLSVRRKRKLDVELIRNVLPAIGEEPLLGVSEFWGGLGQEPISMVAEDGRSVLRMLDGRFISTLELGMYPVTS
jgi:hypothetical protein